MNDEDAAPAKASAPVGDEWTPEPLVHDLSNAQHRAAGMLVMGHRPGVVAERLEISRATLWRWRQTPEFRQQIQRLRVELHVGRIDRMWSLADLSLDVVEENLREGDLQAALSLLRLLQIRSNTPLPDGPEPSLVDEGETEEAIDPNVA